MAVSSALFSLTVALLLNSGLALECHTCNSEEDVGCGLERFKPQFPTDDYAECDASSRRTLQELHSLVLPQLQPSEQPTNLPQQHQTCLKFKVTSKNSTHQVTFRGCSKQSCSSVQQLFLGASETRLEGCHECSNKNLCNAAPAAIGLSSALLAPLLALFSARRPI
ncbi:Hypothetical predicted protein [Cloeon dipterum]|uniref:Protein quiver n=1 Tax=Cloeon dipterum TaxID=197152 RepID=A0A8S1E5R0_9INSE|nr:Hypothetical predicted protein [Cloeon dipterum]